MKVTGLALLVAVGLMLYVLLRKRESFDVTPTVPIHDALNGEKLLAEAIAFAEGFGQPGAIPTQAHNPGDLKIPGWSGPTLGEGISVFESDSEGWSRLYGQLRRIRTGGSKFYTPSMTISQMGATWVGNIIQGVDWANNVVFHLRTHGFPAVTGNTTLAEIFGPETV